MKRSISIWAVHLALFLSVPVFAQLNLSPTEIDINDVSQSRKVLITIDGQPVSAAEIINITSGVTKTGAAVPKNVSGKTHFSNYSYMFEFETGDDGFITITPNKGLVEVGSYDLFIHTIHGKVKGLINANLRDSIPRLPYDPANLSAFRHGIELPDYTYGQVVSIDLNPDSKNLYTWYIDGQVHSSGLGETSFRAWPEPGVREISYVAQSTDGTVVSRWSDTTKISVEEPIESSVRKGYKIPFSAPSGYSEVSWSLDGKLVSEKQLDRSEGDTHLVSFRTKGKHTLTCLARGSQNGDFRRITWEIKVN